MLNDLNGRLGVLLGREEEQHETPIHEVEADDQKIVHGIGHRLIGMEGLQEEGATAPEEGSAHPKRHAQGQAEINTVFPKSEIGVVHRERVATRRLKGKVKPALPMGRALIGGGSLVACVPGLAKLRFCPGQPLRKLRDLPGQLQNDPVLLLHVTLEESQAFFEGLVGVIHQAKIGGGGERGKPRDATESFGTTKRALCRINY